MTISRLRIVPRNFHDEATLVTSIAPVTGYSILNTQNGIRSRVWRSPDGTDQFVGGSFDDGLDRTISHFSFFRHRCHGGQVRLELFSDSAYSSQVFDSGPLDIINITPTDDNDWGIDPYGLGSNDPFLTESPYWLWLDPVPCLSYRVSYSDVNTVFGYDYWQVSRFFVGNYFEVGINPDYGATLGFIDQTDRNRSRGGSLRTNSGPAWRTMQMDFTTLAETDRAAWLDIMRYCGTGKDFVLSLFPEDGTRLERDNIVNAKFSSLDPIVRQSGYLTKRIQIEEI